MTRKQWAALSGTALMVGGLAATATAEIATLGPAKDNTLYEPAPKTSEASNGAGEYMFAGRNFAGQLRRCVMKFDLAAALPAGSTITAVELTLHCSRAAGGVRTTTLHRLTADWGEGASDAFAPGGLGATPEPGDCTWTERFFGLSLPWASAGGDFVATESGQTTTDLAPAFVTYSSTAAMVADAQSWLDDPAQNFGWIMRGDEGLGIRAGKRYDTRENVDPALRPQLIVTFDPPLLIGDMNCDGVVSVGDIAGFVLALTNPTQYAIQFPTCDIDAADVNQDSVVSVGDIGGFVALLTGG